MEKSFGPVPGARVNGWMKRAIYEIEAESGKL